jgi:hypothetical protein
MSHRHSPRKQEKGEGGQGHQVVPKRRGGERGGEEPRDTGWAGVPPPQGERSYQEREQQAGRLARRRVPQALCPALHVLEAPGIQPLGDPSSGEATDGDAHEVMQEQIGLEEERHRDEEPRMDREVGEDLLFLMRDRREQDNRQPGDGDHRHERTLAAPAILAKQLGPPQECEEWSTATHRARRFGEGAVVLCHHHASDHVHV